MPRRKSLIEQTALYDQIRADNFGPRPWHAYEPWRTKITALLCPSDGEAQQHQPDWNGRNSYVFNVGDTVPWAESKGSEIRGPFSFEETYPFAMISDGLSNTLAMSERCVGTGDGSSLKGGLVIHYPAVTNNPDTANPIECLAQVGSNGRYVSGSDTRGDWTGRRWADGATAFSMFNTILGPNGPTCWEGTWDGNRGIAPPTSYHPGGANALRCDGSVSFISETIDTGDLSQPCPRSGPSPYGVWGAMGSRNGGEAAGS